MGVVRFMMALRSSYSKRTLGSFTEVWSGEWNCGRGQVGGTVGVVRQVELWA